MYVGKERPNTLPRKSHIGEPQKSNENIVDIKKAAWSYQLKLSFGVSLDYKFLEGRCKIFLSLSWLNAIGHIFCINSQKFVFQTCHFSSSKDLLKCIGLYKRLKMCQLFISQIKSIFFSLLEMYNVVSWALVGILHNLCRGRSSNHQATRQKKNV